MVEGNLKPSSDTPTHLVLYRAFKEIGGVVHTHSLYATSWRRRNSRCSRMGTTQADYWHGDVPCTRLLKPAEIKTGLRGQHGSRDRRGIQEGKKFDPMQHPAVLVASHGPFTWGRTRTRSTMRACWSSSLGLNSETLRINPKPKPMQSVLLDKHFLRKHGANAYYGQTGKH